MSSPNLTWPQRSGSTFVRVHTYAAVVRASRRPASVAGGTSTADPAGFAACAPAVEVRAVISEYAVYDISDVSPLRIRNLLAETYIATTGCLTPFPATPPAGSVNCSWKRPPRRAVGRTTPARAAASSPRRGRSSLWLKHRNRMNPG